MRRIRSLPECQGFRPTPGLDVNALLALSDENAEHGALGVDVVPCHAARSLGQRRQGKKALEAKLLRETSVVKRKDAGM